MIALIASGRGGGDGPPVFFTVPWSPGIAERGEMPGAVFRAIRLLQAIIAEGTPADRDYFLNLPSAALLLSALGIPGYDLKAAGGVLVARHLIRELGMLESAGTRFDRSGQQT